MRLWINGSVSVRADYVLITPAYNESEFIEETMKSVVAQTLSPMKWVIVDDGSSDTTAEIVRQYEKHYDYIECVRCSHQPDRSYYGSNVYAIHEGYHRVEDLTYDYVAILDADMILCPNYYEEIFKRFEMNQDLGIATGTYLEEIDHRLTEALIDRHSTPKALQVFRRACYDQIGGYIPCKNGGEDSCAEVMARMYGWQTWSFRDIQTIHQRPVGARGDRSILHAQFRQGLADYCLAAHPMFMLFKCLRRCLIEKPYVGSGLARFTGFIYGYLTREQRLIPDSVRRYLRQEQVKRMLAHVGIGPKQWKPVQPGE